MEHTVYITSLDDLTKKTMETIIEEAIQKNENAGKKLDSHAIFSTIKGHTEAAKYQDEDKHKSKATIHLKDENERICIRTIVKNTIKPMDSTYTRLKFWEGIEDLEHDIICQLGRSKGYMILVTNKGKLNRKKSRSSAYPICNGIYDSEDLNEYHGTSRHSHVRLQLGPYELCWKEAESGKEYLVVEVSEEERTNKADTAPKQIIPSLLDNICIHSNGFYRGQTSLRFLMLPSALRSNAESRVFHEIITRHPQEYMGLGNLERLTKIQHAGVPTRLLDITLNPLVAIFFAISSLNSDRYDEMIAKDEQKQVKKNKSGISPVLMFIPVDSQEIRSFDSDTCRCLAALAYLDGNEQQQLRCAALMDYFIQIYTNAVVGAYIPKMTSYLESCIIKDTIRLCFHVILRSADVDGKKVHLEKAKDTITNDVRRKIGVKYGKYNNLSQGKSLANIVKDIFDGINLDDGRIIFSNAGKTFTVKASKAPGKSRYNETIIVPEFDIKKEIGDFIIADKEEPFLINPETDEYDYSILLRLHGHIAKEDSAYKMKIRPTDILDGVFVRPVFNSERMVAQHGAFMLYGLSFFWNTWKAIKYFYRNTGTDAEERWTTILTRLVFNDLSFLSSEPSTKKGISSCPSAQRRLHDFMFSIYRLKCWNLDSTDEEKENLRRQLKLLGVDKATLGRSVETTYYDMSRQTARGKS